MLIKCVIARNMYTVGYEDKIKVKVNMVVAYNSSAFLIRMLDKERITIADVIRCSQSNGYISRGLRQLYLVV